MEKTFVGYLEGIDNGDITAWVSIGKILKLHFDFCMPFLHKYVDRLNPEYREKYYRGISYFQSKISLIHKFYEGLEKGVCSRCKNEAYVLRFDDEMCHCLDCYGRAPILEPLKEMKDGSEMMNDSVKVSSGISVKTPSAEEAAYVLKQAMEDYNLSLGSK